MLPLLLAAASQKARRGGGKAQAYITLPALGGCVYIYSCTYTQYVCLCILKTISLQLEYLPGTAPKVFARVVGQLEEG